MRTLTSGIKRHLVKNINRRKSAAGPTLHIRDGIVVRIGSQAMVSVSDRQLLNYYTYFGANALPKWVSGVLEDY